MTDSLIEQIVALEKENISTAIGAGAVWYCKDKYSISLHWVSPHGIFSGKPAGAIRETAGFNDYSEFEGVFSETVRRMRAKITKFLQGAGI